MIAVTSYRSNFPPQPKKFSPPQTNTTTSPFISLLQKCHSLQQLHQLHAQFLKFGAINDPLFLTNLITLSSQFSFESYDYVFRILHSISYRNNPIIWKSVIRELSLGSMPEQSILLYVKMVEEEPFCVNSHVFPSVLKACSRVHGLYEGTQIHGYAIKMNTVVDPYVQNSIIQKHWKCGKLYDARRLFDYMSEKSVVSWNSIISGYAELGLWEDVKSLFFSMVERSSSTPNSITLVKMISACTKSRDFEAGKWVHRYIEENGVELSLNIGNALVKIGDMSEASRIFDQMLEWNVVSWTTLVSGYAGLGCLGPARELFVSCLETIYKANQQTNKHHIASFVKEDAQGNLINQIVENRPVDSPSINEVIILRDRLHSYIF